VTRSDTQLERTWPALTPPDRAATIERLSSALIASGNDSLRAGNWAAARAAFEAALAHEEIPEGLFGLGDALWWLGEVEEAISCRERAYAAFRRRPDPAQAAITAMRLCLTYRANLGNRAMARGWANRATRLVQEFHLELLRGWGLLTRASDADDPAEGERIARDAHEIARRSRDADLELCALSEIGAWLVALGRAGEGFGLLDEAMAAALGGECESLNTVVYVACHVLVTCSRAADFERGVEWVRAIDGFSERHGCPFLYTMCRTLYGRILFATGKWTRAEEELLTALKMAKKAERGLYGEVLASLAELRVAQGRLEEAEQLLAGFEDQPGVGHVAAAVHLMRSEPVVAESVVARSLREVRDEPQARARLLELRAQCEIVRGAVEDAVATARQLRELGASLQGDWLGARCERILGRALSAAGDRPAARAHLEAALAVFARLGHPLDAARTCVNLAEVLLADERDTAVAEARKALAVFEELGAARDADGAAALLRSLGVKAARSGPKRAGILTRRERDVLDLLGQGLSNREIGARLFVSRKTVEHHVASVLAKLGLVSRAQAAAYFARTIGPD
jgi:DNA-binding CsgD family transcriptional regulator